MTANASIDAQGQADLPPVQAQYYFATLGSMTRDGGVVMAASSQLAICDVPVAWAGDEVRYPDGRIAHIMDGGAAEHFGGDRPVALIGSRVTGGDSIITTTKYEVCLVQYEGRPRLQGLFDLSWYEQHKQELKA